MTSTTTVSIMTDKASGYLQQLCKHFGHKIEVAFTPEAGNMRFGFGRADLEARAGVLKISASAENDEDLARLQKVLASHLERFAFREDLKIEWED